MYKKLFIIPTFATILISMSTLTSANNVINDFNKGPLGGWNEVSGNWTEAKGRLRVDAPDEQATIFFGENLRKNCIIEVDVAFDEIFASNFSA